MQQDASSIILCDIRLKRDIFCQIIKIEWSIYQGFHKWSLKTLDLENYSNAIWALALPNSNNFP